METLTELLRDPPTWVSVVQIVVGSMIGLYVLERISAWRAGQEKPDSE